MSTAAPVREPPPRRAVGQFVRLATPYWRSERKWTVRGATLLLFGLTLGQVALVIWTSYWNRGFFDALDARSLPNLLRQVAVFVLILALTMVVTALHMHVKRWLQLDWRRWLTGRMMDQWMTRARHYRLQFAEGEHDNPDQRIAEDIRIATESSISLAHSLVYSLLIGASFIDILLNVSGTANLPGTNVVVPGYMVLLAFLYAGTGALLGFILGRPLVTSTNRLQTVEANLRFSLARAREHSESIALMHGERLERRSAARLFGDVATGWNRQTVAYLGIVSFSTAYGNLLPVFPILVAAPEYIAGTMTLGLLMQAAQAFQQLTSALSWPIDNLGQLANWRASAGRVVSLHEDMEALEQPPKAPELEGIRLIVLPHPELVIRHLRLITPAGRTLVEDFNLRVRRGERLLITGDATVTLGLFKAVAGLWPWGSGEIGLPDGQEMVFLPQQPFLPTGSLRAALCYPHSPGHYATAVVHRALECAGIAWLAPRLEESDDWNRVLPLRAQQRLGLTRVFLQQPGWVFLEDATNAFDSRGEVGMMDMLHRELPNSTLITITQHGGLEHFHDRKLELHRVDEAPAPSPDSAPALSKS